MARFIDTDTGESQLHLVRVPEGVSIQMSNRDEITHGGANDYISVVLNRQAMRDLSDALREMADPPRWR